MTTAALPQNITPAFAEIHRQYAIIYSTIIRQLIPVIHSQAARIHKDYVATQAGLFWYAETDIVQPKIRLELRKATDEGIIRMLDPTTSSPIALEVFYRANEPLPGLKFEYQDDISERGLDGIGPFKLDATPHLLQHSMEQLLSDLNEYMRVVLVNYSRVAVAGSIVSRSTSEISEPDLAQRFLLELPAHFDDVFMPHTTSQRPQKVTARYLNNGHSMKIEIANGPIERTFWVDTQLQDIIDGPGKVFIVKGRSAVSQNYQSQLSDPFEIGTEGSYEGFQALLVKTGTLIKKHIVPGLNSAQPVLKAV